MRATGGRVGRASRGAASPPGAWLAAHAGLAVAAILAATVAALLAMGRSPICPCGTVALWHGSVQSDQNSQQIADWCSLSHVVHGLLFYAAGWCVIQQSRIRCGAGPWTAPLVLAVALGSATARRLPWWAGAGLVVILEAVALVAIRDILTLNLIMPIAPVGAVRHWQAG